MINDQVRGVCSGPDRDAPFGAAPRKSFPPSLRVRTYALILLLYAVLTCLATYPLATKPHRLMLGTPGDSALWAWNFSWTRQAILINHGLPFFGDFSYRPYPQAMLHHTHTFFYGMIYCLGSLLYENPYFWSNMFLMMSFVLAAYGTFLLARLVSGQTAGALVAGAIFAFCSARMVRATGHLNILSNEWIPWYLYFLLRAGRENRARLYIAAALCFAATTWNEYYNSLFIILFTLLYLILAPILRLHHGHPLKARLRSMSYGLGLAFLLLLPYAWGLWRTINTFEIIPIKGVDQFHVSLLNYLLPAPDHRLLYPWLAPIYQGGIPGNQSESTVFFGYLAIILALCGIVAIHRKSREYKFFLVCFGFFFIMSLGVSVRLGFAPRCWDIAMPYALFMKIPFFQDFRSPARFGCMVALCMAVLAACGFRVVTERIASRGKLALLAGGMIGLVLLENLFAPYRNYYDAFDPARIPQKLLEIIKRDPGRGAVFSYPPRHEDWQAIRMQTLHHKPIVTGVTARPTPSQRDYYNLMDLRGWFDPNPKQSKSEPPAPWTQAAAGRFCYFFNLGYLIIPPNQSNQNLAGRLKQGLFPLRAAYREGDA